MDAQKDKELIRQLKMQLAQRATSQSSASRRSGSSKHQSKSKNSSRYTTASAADTGSDVPDSDVLEPLIAQAKDSGRRYALFYSPWAPSDDIWNLLSPEPPQVDPTDYNTRYPRRANEAAKQAAINSVKAVELYNHLPFTVRPFAHNKAVQRGVSTSASITIIGIVLIVCYV